MIQSTLCYLERGDEYLMLHRVKKKNDMNHDKWIGVGGKFEDKESPEDCLLRETLEETGLTLTEYRYRGLVTFVSDVYPTEYMHLFTATAWEGESHPCDEGELAWIKKEKLLSLPDELVVYSGHDYGCVPSRTLAEERINNPEVTPEFLEKLRKSGS